MELKLRWINICMKTTFVYVFVFSLPQLFHMHSEKYVTLGQESVHFGSKEDKEV